MLRTHGLLTLGESVAAAFSPHAPRHTYASLLLVAGVDVYYISRMLGHASIQETADMYGRWLPANRRGALDVLDDAHLLSLVRAGIVFVDGVQQEQKGSARTEGPKTARSTLSSRPCRSTSGRSNQ